MLAECGNVILMTRSEPSENLSHGHEPDAELSDQKEDPKQTYETGFVDGLLNKAGSTDVGNLHVHRILRCIHIAIAMKIDVGLAEIIHSEGQILWTLRQILVRARLARGLPRLDFNPCDNSTIQRNIV